MTKSLNKSKPRKPRAKKQTPIQVVLPPEGFVRIRTVLAVYGITKSTLWRWIAEGRFVKPKKLSPGCTVWDVADLRAHMDRIRQGGA